jgi:similar to spore coat protein
MTLAVHETLEIHELLMFKSVCTTKSSTMQALVADPELKRILSLDVESSQRHLAELSSLVQPQA